MVRKPSGTAPEKKLNIWPDIANVANGGVVRGLLSMGGSARVTQPTRLTPQEMRAQALAYDGNIAKKGRVSYDAVTKKFVGKTITPVTRWTKQQDNLNTITQFKQLLNTEQASKRYRGIADLAAGRELDKLLIHQVRDPSDNARSAGPADAVVGAKMVSGRTFEHIKTRFRNYNNILDTTKRQLMEDRRFKHLPPGALDRIVCSIDMKALAESAHITPPDLTAEMTSEERQQAEAVHQYALNQLVHDAAFAIADAISRPYTMQSRKHPVFLRKDDGTEKLFCRGYYLASKALSSLDIAAVTKRLTQASSTGGINLQDKDLVRKEFKKAFVQTVRKERQALKEENFNKIAGVLGTRTDQKDVIGPAVTNRLRLNGAGFALAAAGKEPYLKATDSYPAAITLDKHVKDDAGFDAETATAKNFHPKDAQLADNWTNRPLEQKDLDGITAKANRYIDQKLAQWQAHNKRFAEENPLVNDYIDQHGRSLNDEARERARVARLAYEPGPADRLTPEELEGRKAPPAHHDYDPKTDPSVRNAKLVETLVSMERAGKSDHDGETIMGLFRDLQACGDDGVKLEAALQRLPKVEEAHTQYLLDLREQLKTWSKDADALRRRLETVHRSDVCQNLMARNGSPIDLHVSGHYDKTLDRAASLKRDITRLQKRIDTELAGRPKVGPNDRLRAMQAGLRYERNECGRVLKSLEKEPIEEMDVQSVKRLNDRVLHDTKRGLKAEAKWKKIHKAIDASAATRPDLKKAKLDIEGPDGADGTSEALQALAKRINQRALDRIAELEKAN